MAEISWFGSPGGLNAPATAAFSITPSDSADLTFITRGVWIGGAGTLNVDMMSGQTISFVGIPAGTLLPIAVKRVRATGTTATNITGVY